MILGIGTDLIEVDRISGLWKTRDSARECIRRGNNAIV